MFVISEADGSQQLREAVATREWDLEFSKRLERTSTLVGLLWLYRGVQEEATLNGMNIRLDDFRLGRPGKRNPRLLRRDFSRSRKITVLEAAVEKQLEGRTLWLVCAIDDPFDLDELSADISTAFMNEPLAGVMAFGLIVMPTESAYEAVAP